MNIRALISTLLFIVLLSGCNSIGGVQDSKVASLDLSLEDLLVALDDVGIHYETRTETQNIYDLRRDGAERHLYQLGAGKLTIYRFLTVDQRIEVQRDPFPTASAVPPNGSYGMGRILVFYYDGDNEMAQKLAEAFEPFGFEERRS